MSSTTTTIAEKTYSGQQSYHEMLVRAQAYCPALLYFICKKLLGITIDPKRLVQKTEEFPMHEGIPEWTYFGKDYKSARIHKMMVAIFQEQTVDVRGFGRDKSFFLADTSFVEYLKSGIVTLDDEKRLVTIHS